MIKHVQSAPEKWRLQFYRFDHFAGQNAAVPSWQSITTNQY